MNAKTSCAAVLMVLTLAACSKGPPTAEMERRLALEMPAVLTLDRFNVELTENVGTEQTPIYTSRFTARAKTRETTYELVDILEDRQLIREKIAAGRTIDFYGTAQSRRSGESWQFTFYLEGLNQSAYGSRRAAFADNAIIEGTEEASAWIREANERRQAREEAARVAAEQARIEQEQREAQARLRQRQIEELIAKHSATLVPGNFSRVCLRGGSQRVNLFLVTADQESQRDIWGGNPHYFYSSAIEKAVVHSGALEHGETGVVRVTCSNGVLNYPGVPRNGVTSNNQSLSNLHVNGAYTVTLVEKLPMVVQ